MAQGLPQGAVLSPILFLLYTHDLLREVPNGVEISGYAENEAIWSTHRDIDAAKRNVQTQVNKVCLWAKENKAELNPSKSEGILFSTDNKDWSLQSQLFINGRQINFKKNCRFLGVLNDNGLSFRGHM